MTSHGRVRVTRAGTSGAYRAELTMLAADGTPRRRALAAETCDLAVDAVAIVFVASQADVAVPRVDRPASDLAAQASVSDIAPRHAPSPRELVVWLAARPVFDRGLVPENGFGGAVDLGIGTDRWRGELRVTGLAPTTGMTPGGSTGELWALAADIGACGARPLVNVRLGACIGITTGVLFGRGVEVENAQRELRFVPAPKLSADVRWPARGTIAVRLDAQARVALARPDFVVRDDGSLHRPALFSLQLALGPELRF